MRLSRVILMSSIVLSGLGMMTNAQADSSQSAKKMTVSYVSTSGKQLKASKTMTTTGKKVNAYGNKFVLNGTGHFGEPSPAGYVKKIKGYVPFTLKKNYTYSSLPAKVTVKYIKESTLNKKVAASYIKQFNAYRKSHHLKTLKHSKSLKRKVNARAHELWQRDDHIRPNGKSYNTKGSGYAETMAEIPRYYVTAGVIEGGLGAELKYNKNGNITYQGTARTVVHELMTVDKIHRNTELNKWARYSEASFSFASDGSAMMAQLFH